MRRRVADAWYGGNGDRRSRLQKADGGNTGAPARSSVNQRLLDNRHEPALLPGTARTRTGPDPGRSPARWCTPGPRSERTRGGSRTARSRPWPGGTLSCTGICGGPDARVTARAGSRCAPGVLPCSGRSGAAGCGSPPPAGSPALPEIGKAGPRVSPASRRVPSAASSASRFPGPRPPGRSPSW